MAPSDPVSSCFEGIKAIFFDFMGTCLDWHTAIVQTLPSRIEFRTRSALAIAWREAFFEDIHARFEKDLPLEDIDLTHTRLLQALLNAGDFALISLSPQEQEQAVNAWHRMSAWPDVPPALARLRETYEAFVLANGTTRLQLDLARSSRLRYDMLFSSQLLGATKPDPEMYKKGMRLVDVEPHVSLMVAAHAYDLRAAKQVGMKTVYIRRWTEDTKENMEEVRRSVDYFIGGTESDSEGIGRHDGQLSVLADIMCINSAKERMSLMDEDSMSW